MPFWDPVGIQNKKVWALADTGSCRNLINKDFFDNLPVKPSMFPPGNVTVIAGDGESLDLLGWAVLNLEVAHEIIYHEFGVVRDLSIDLLLRGEMMKPHMCALQYDDKGRNTFKMGRST